MTHRLKEVVKQTLGEDGVSFIENGDRPSISFKEQMDAWLAIDNISGNARYAMKLLGINPGRRRGKKTNGAKIIDGMENIIVPGYASRNSTFSSMREVLEDNGFQSHAVNAYEDLRFRRPLTTFQSADLLKRRIEDSPADIVNLICHSMGGIIALIACENLREEDRERIGRIVTLGTPWNGTTMAKLLALVKQGDGALRDLSPQSYVLDRVVPQVGNDIKRKTVSIGSAHDVIVPWESSILDGSLLNAVLRRGKAVTHANFLHEDHVAQTVAEVLKEAA